MYCLDRECQSVKDTWIISGGAQAFKFQYFGVDTLNTQGERETCKGLPHPMLSRPGIT